MTISTTPLHDGSGAQPSDTSIPTGPISPSLPPQTPISPSTAHTPLSNILSPTKTPISERRKWSLLALFSLGIFIDTWGFAAFFVFTSLITQDLSVRFEQQSWVVNSYSVSFASFLLAWGRGADIYTAKAVFAYPFVALGVLSLANSFVPEKISFFIIRALSGIAGAALIPASYRLIVLIFEPRELRKAFATYGLAGGLANSTGLLISGLMQNIPGGWRWFFRLLSDVILPFAIGALYWIPPPPPRAVPITDKWKRLDLIGSTAMLLSILLFLLGLTLGASDGWGTPQFFVSLSLSFALLAFFFSWEARIPAEYAILPPSVWSIQNYTIFNIMALYPYCWWSVIFISFIEIFVRINGDTFLTAAVRMVPISISSAILTIFLVIFPDLVRRPRWPLTIGMLVSLVAYGLFILSNGGAASNYWKFVFPGLVLGSAAAMLVLIAANVGIMTSVPPEMAGVAGAIFQVALQIGSVVGLSIQAGLFTVQEGGLDNWANVRAGYIFVLGFGTVWLAAFWIFFKADKGTSQIDRAEQGGEVENGEAKMV